MSCELILKVNISDLIKVAKYTRDKNQCKIIMTLQVNTINLVQVMRSTSSCLLLGNVITTSWILKETQVSTKVMDLKWTFRISTCHNNLMRTYHQKRKMEMMIFPILMTMNLNWIILVSMSLINWTITQRSTVTV